MVISLGDCLHFVVVSFPFKSSDLGLERHFENTATSRLLQWVVQLSKQKQKQNPTVVRQ